MTCDVVFYPVTDDRAYCDRYHPGRGHECVRHDDNMHVCSCGSRLIVYDWKP